MKVESAMRRLRVERVERPADHVVSLWLVDAAGDRLPRWSPGAHVDLILPSGLVRQYSLCGDPNDLSECRIAVLLEPEGRGGSREIHETDLLGKELHGRGPRNLFKLVEAPAYLFIAGGIGVTPLLAQAQYVSRAGAAWTFAYGGRTRSSMAFVDELEALPNGALTLYPEDEVGLLPVEDLVAKCPGAPVYCCGPEPMIRAVQAACDRLGRRGDLHFERFGAATDKVVAPNPAEGFEVEISSTAEVLWVPPDRSILNVLRDLRGDLMSSCEEGFCGACEVGVVSGIPEHRDTILTDEDHAKNESMMICVGRSKSPRLVLDI
jgi:ferredoxin-NADP reductase